MIPDVMQGILLTGHGNMDKMEFSNEIPVPKPGSGDVLIRVGAAGVNNTDINTRLAWYSKKEGGEEDASWAGEALGFPRIQGIDVCGHVVAVGSDVVKSRIGERVLVEPCFKEYGGKKLEYPYFLGSECDGGFAEYVVVPSVHAYCVNSSLSDIELASFPCSYSTAENLLTRTGVKKGERVLVTGASGGVGSAAVQLAKARDAYVIAVTSPSKSQGLMDLGADETVFRYDDIVEILGENSVDVVVDLVAGSQFPGYLEILRPRGRYGVAGAIGGPIVDLDVRNLYLKDLSFYGCTELEPEVFANLLRCIETGKIAPVVAETFDLSDICKAQEMFLEKNFIGKIVLQIGEQTQ